MLIVENKTGRLFKITFFKIDRFNLVKKNNKVNKEVSKTNYTFVKKYKTNETNQTGNKFFNPEKTIKNSEFNLEKVDLKKGIKKGSFNIDKKKA